MGGGVGREVGDASELLRCKEEAVSYADAVRSETKVINGRTFMRIIVQLCDV